MLAPIASNLASKAGKAAVTGSRAALSTTADAAHVVGNQIRERTPGALAAAGALSTRVKLGAAATVLGGAAIGAHVLGGDSAGPEGGPQQATEGQIQTAGAQRSKPAGNKNKGKSEANKRHKPKSPTIPENPKHTGDAVRRIHQEFSKLGGRGATQAVIAASMQESGGGSIDFDARQPDGDYAMGWMQTFPLGAASSGPYIEDVKKAHNNRNAPVTKYYQSGEQIEDTARWWTPAIKSAGKITSASEAARVALEAQAAGDPAYLRHVAQYWDDARGLVNEHVK